MRESELILNPDGSIYHLALLPGEIGSTIILVGDQDRVKLISQHFDSIDLKKQRREFVTHTGWIGDNRISVISTGIGTDNIDIVMHELDALVNIDFHSRLVKNDIQSLNIIRLGTSGSINDDIHLDETIVSKYAIGTDSLGQYYGLHQSPHEFLPPWSYFTKAFDYDLTKYPGTFKEGITITCPGFYAAQGRSLRLVPEYKLDIEHLHNIYIHGLPVTNIDMETSGIYLLAEKMGHKAITFNLILAHRLQRKFAKDYLSVMNRTILDILNWVCMMK